MTRRSIITVLGSLLVGLLLIVSAPSVAADNMRGGSSATVIVTAGEGCDSADAATVDACVALAVNQPSVSVAGAGAPVAVPTSDSRFLEMNTTTLPSVGDPSAPASDQRAIYRVSDSYYYVPAAGGMWLVIHDPVDGLPVIEDVVSGPPPATGTAITLQGVGGAGALMPMMTEQQRTLEESTTAASTVPYYRTIDGVTDADRLTSQGTTASIANVTRECTHPVIGFPTCYSLQADGTWAREELADVDTGWVVVSTVTYDEMKAAIDEANAGAP
jgi:hypothetical protein